MLQGSVWVKWQLDVQICEGKGSHFWPEILVVGMDIMYCTLHHKGTIRLISCSLRPEHPVEIVLTGLGCEPPPWMIGSRCE